MGAIDEYMRSLPEEFWVGMLIGACFSAVILVLIGGYHDRDV